MSLWRSRPQTHLSAIFFCSPLRFLVYKYTSEIKPFSSNQYSISYIKFKIKQNTIQSQSPLSCFREISDMGIRLPSILLNAKQILKMQALSARNQSDVPKSHIAVYVGDIQKKRFVVPISYLKHPSFVICSIDQKRNLDFAINSKRMGFEKLSPLHHSPSIDQNLKLKRFCFPYYHNRNKSSSQ